MHPERIVSSIEINFINLLFPLSKPNNVINSIAEIKASLAFVPFPKERERRNYKTLEEKL